MEDKDRDDAPERPSAKHLEGGYNQTYIIMKSLEESGKSTRNEAKDSGSASGGADLLQDANAHETLFRCGNWCYLGFIQLGHLKLGTSDLPVIIPTLQRQQGNLRYFCNANRYSKTRRTRSPGSAEPTHLSPLTHAML
jgi:hypothetical protein